MAVIAPYSFSSLKIIHTVKTDGAGAYAGIVCTVGLSTMAERVGIRVTDHYIGESAQFRGSKIILRTVSSRPPPPSPPLTCDRIVCERC